MKKKVLYLFDDINYRNGVRTVTSLQISYLMPYYDVHLFSLVEPDADTRKLYGLDAYEGSELWDEFRIIGTELRTVLTSPSFRVGQKLLRLSYTFQRHIGLEKHFMDKHFYHHLWDRFNSYDVVVVISEASKLRFFSSTLSHPKKLQWIHTNYQAWYSFNWWSRQVTKDDATLYQDFDQIITLSKENQRSFLAVHPHLSDKVRIIENLLPEQSILEKSKLECTEEIDPIVCNLITLCRFDGAKALDRLVRVARRLKLAEIQFCWFLVGDGELYSKIKSMIQEYSLQDCLKLTGAKENPYPLLAKCDLFVLPSAHEGTPVTIYEAFLLQVPVFATSVGGIPDQMQNEPYGELCENNEEAIFHGLQALLEHPDRLQAYKAALAGYHYPNEHISRKLLRLMEDVIGREMI